MIKRSRTRSATQSRCVRPSSTKRGYDRRWRKRRAHKLNADPWCELCGSVNRYTPAVEVHHILPLADGGTHAFSNLMSLCSPCHSRVTNKWKDLRSAAGAKRAALQSLERAGASESVLSAVRRTLDRTRADASQGEGGVESLEGDEV